jgi:hypothetical protein
MRTAVLELHSSSECSFSRVTQIAALGTELEENVASVLAAFTAGQTFSGIVKGALRELQDVAAQAGTVSLDDVNCGWPERLEDFSERYTMQVERDVHQSVAGGAHSAELLPVDESGASPVEEQLGDNVELF